MIIKSHTQDINQIYFSHFTVSPMSVPVTPFSKLTLEEMSPTNQSAFHTGLESYDRLDPTLQDSSSDLESCSDESEDEDELSMVVQSPTKLAYNIHHLPEKAQDAVRDVFG